MILKEIDSKDKEIKTLEKLLTESKNEKQKILIQKDLNNLKAGYEKEKENAYLLDFEFLNSKNVLVIHDLRLEHNGRTAQIDHILLTRLGIEVLESKSTNGELTIKSDNSIEIQYRNRKVAYPNPLEQAKRHALVIKDILKDNKLLTNKIGRELDIMTNVLFNPKTLITNDTLPENFVRADSFIKERLDFINNIGIKDMIKFTTGLQKIDSIKEIASFLISQHKPIKFDYNKKYPIKKETKIEEPVIKEIIIDNSLKEGDSCPKCNVGTLKKRELKNKKYENKYNSNTFLGCSNYPKCRFSESL